MTTELLFALTGAGLIAVGFYVLIAIPHLLRKILAFNVLSGGIFLVLVGLGQHGGGADPVPQALVLTGIVVAFASTALAVLLLRRWFQASGRATLEPEHAYPMAKRSTAQEQEAGSERRKARDDETEDDR